MCSATLMPTSAGSCAGATVEVSSLSVNGTLTFNADNTTQSNAQIMFDESAHYPNACYSQAQCIQVQGLLTAAADVTRASCAYNAASGCDCTVMVASQSASVGTYQTAGSTLTITSTSQGTTETDTYCVSGNTLTVQNINPLTGALSTLTLTK